MRSHWTNRTILERFTIPILSAAALLAACERSAPTAPRPVISAAAAATTVSAHGNGQVATTQECDVGTPGVCTAGGQGAQFSFTFSGTNMGTPTVIVTGVLSVKFRETGDVVEYQGVANLVPSQHLLIFTNATCSVTTAAGTTFFATCQLTAQERASAGFFSFSFFDPMGSAFGFAGGEVVSGGMKIG